MARSGESKTNWTAKSYLFDEAPKRIRLLGDVSSPESAQHIIEFPGGAIEVSRLDNGEYWAHIMVNDGQWLEDVDGRLSARGVVVDSRIDWSWGHEGPNVEPIERAAEIHQIAVRIRPTRP